MDAGSTAELSSVARGYRRNYTRDLDEIRALAGRGTPEEKRAALRKAAREFEAVFLYQMISAMRKTVGDGGLTEKSNARRIFESMLDEEWARKLAGKEGNGSLSDLLYRQLSRSMGLEEEDATPTRNAEDFLRSLSGARAESVVPARVETAEEKRHE